MKFFCTHVGFAHLRNVSIHSSQCAPLAYITVNIWLRVCGWRDSTLSRETSATLHVRVLSSLSLISLHVSPPQSICSVKSFLFLFSLSSLRLSACPQRLAPRWLSAAAGVVFEPPSASATKNNWAVFLWKATPLPVKKCWPLSFCFALSFLAEFYFHMTVL